jgi:hypothetical protein
VLKGISHADFQKLQPEWHEAIGSATSITIPKQGVSNIMPMLIFGLEAARHRKKPRFQTTK